MTSLPVLAMLRQIGPDDAALDDAEVSYNIKKGFHIMEKLFFEDFTADYF